MPSATHLTPEVLTAYILGRLAWEQFASVEGHLDNCPDCQRRAVTMDSASDSFIALLRQPGPSTATASAPPPLPGNAEKLSGPLPKRVAGFEIVRELAHGGLGVVYLAKHPDLAREQAVKLLLPKHRDDTGLLARFRREKWAIARMEDKQHVVEIFDAGVDNEFGPYLAMQYLKGESLNTVMARRGPLPEGEACELVRQAALGLQSAHDLGLVHRDVKPSNLMLARFGDKTELKVIDWGLVKAVTEQERPTPEATSPGALIGTPDYMAPEQAAPDPENPVGPAADVYSLGCTLYALLSGKPPFNDRPILQKLTGHVAGEFPKVIRPNLHAEVISLLNAMVDKNAARRPTARTVAERLAPFGCDADRLRALLGAPVPETADDDIYAAAAPETPLVCRRRGLPGGPPCGVRGARANLARQGEGDLQ